MAPQNQDHQESPFAAPRPDASSDPVEGAEARDEAPGPELPESRETEPPPVLQRDGFESERAGRGLAAWLLLLLVFGVGGLLLGMQELSAMAAISGLYVLSQAADMNPRWRPLHYAVTWVVPASGLMITVLIAFQLFAQSDTSQTARLFLAPAILVAALVCVFSALRPFANVVAAALFRTSTPSYTLRLTARITIVILVLTVPGWFALRAIFDELFDPTTPLLNRASLEGQLLGYMLLALAGVAFLIRRNFRQTLERLGIGRITGRHLAISALGVVSLYGLNAGADWIQQTFFRSLWQADHQVNEAIASGLGPGRIALLGVSAGVGEELTLRGALQPKMGLVMTSLLFASLHLQYSWFGIIVIFVLSLILGTIRIKTNTSVAMAVHAFYDMAALISV